MSDDERRKKSWRERDRQNDRSRHTERERKPRSSRDKRSSDKYRKDLDKLFKSSSAVPERFKEMMKGLEPEEGTPEAEQKAAVAKLREVDGFREFATAVLAFREEGWELPDDENLLIRMLDYPDERVVRDTLVHIAELAGRRDLERVTPLKNRLSTIKTMSDDPRTRKAIAAVEDAIG